MALRAFRSNPSIGGFGGESGFGGLEAASTAALLSSSGPKGRKGGAAAKKAAAGDFLGKELRPFQVREDKQTDTGNAAAANFFCDAERSCDAFAQIVKELVDNAVDACGHCGGGGGGIGGRNIISDDAVSERSVLKRVRVQIDEVRCVPKKGCPGRGDDGNGHGGDASDGIRSEDDWDEDEDVAVLRVTVSDNGCGMKNIEECVSAFHTSKCSKVSREDRPETKDGGEVEKNSFEPQGRQKPHTAGRYGIGLTLCLLHAQRLVPCSKASITSATAQSTSWTRSSYVVDADSDKVRCVEKETRPKRRKDESGTAVSLLVPGGDAARRAWPRLAEYLSRFQLSIHLNCSLEVKAPTLSSAPLFIRPPIEVDHRAKLFEFQRQKQGSHSQDYGSPGHSERDAKDNDSACWNDGMIDGDDVKSGDESSTISTESNKLKSEGAVRKKQSHSSHMKEQQTKGNSFSRGYASKEYQDLEHQRRLLTLQSVSSYLKKTTIKLKNVATSLQPIRTGDKADFKRTNATHLHTCENFHPTLEVDVIVHNAGEIDDDPDEDDLDTGDEFENVFRQRNYRCGDSNPAGLETPGSTAQLMLIRMVNRIPLLDGAEASACGIVQALSGQAPWNTFGLDVSSISAHGATGKVDATPESSPDLHIPTYAVKDSVQVAPFFQSSTHSLFGVVGDDDQSDSDVSDHSADCSEVAGGYFRENRKRSAYAGLLPAGLRLGNMLIIVQINAEPSSLPLPTLSKGRLPLNNKGIDDALQVGLSSCLQSLQRTNPGLLLTSHQLKETARNVRYIPAVAASLASIICNSKSLNFQRFANYKVVEWGEKNKKRGDGEQRQATLSLTSERPCESRSAVSSSKLVPFVLSPREHPCRTLRLEQLKCKTSLQVNTLGPKIEAIVRLSIAKGGKAKKNDKQRKKLNKTSQDSNKVGDSQRDENDRDRTKSNRANDDGENNIELDDILSCQQLHRRKRKRTGEFKVGGFFYLTSRSGDNGSFGDRSSFMSNCKYLSSPLSSDSIEAEKVQTSQDIDREIMGCGDDNFDDDWW